MLASVGGGGWREDGEQNTCLIVSGLIQQLALSYTWGFGRHVSWDIR